MSAVLKENPIETIFDCGVTDAELLDLFYGYPETKDEYIDGLSHDGLLVDIVRLYQLRGNDDLARKYLSSITSQSIRAELSTRGCCVAHS